MNIILQNMRITLQIFNYETFSSFCDANYLYTNCVNCLWKFWVYMLFWVNVSSMWIVARVLGCNGAPMMMFNGAIIDVAMNCNLVSSFKLLVTLIAFASIFPKQHICWYYEQCHHVNLLKKLPQKNQSINSNNLLVTKVFSPSNSK